MKINFLTTNFNQHNIKRPQKPAYRENLNKTNPLQFKGEDGDSSIYDIFLLRKHEESLRERIQKELEAEREIIVNYHSGKLYQEKLRSHPSVAFFYNPDLTRKKKLEMLNESETIFSRAELANKTGLHPEKFIFWIENENLEAEKVSGLIMGNDVYYIDIETPENKAFLEYIKSILPHSVTGEYLLMKCGFSQGGLRNLVKQGKLRPVGFKDEIPDKNIGAYNLLFDTEDEVNKNTLERHLRMTPMPSKKYGEGKKRFVPVTYLEKLGYGSAQSLYNMVKDGTLSGRIKPLDDNRVAVVVDIGAKNVRLKLDRLRGQNPDIMSAESFMEETGLTKTEFKSAVSDGEIEIIREYIFKSDDKDILLSRKNPKNTAFLDRVYFERQLEEERAVEKRAEIRKKRIANIKNPIESLRRTLVWSMCPYTKMVASEEAKKDGAASKVIGKLSEEGIESLSSKEEIKYKSYCKGFWAIAGVKEYKEAHIKAKEIIEQFKKGGIEAVEDPEARKIIIEFLKEYEGIWTP